MLFGWRNANGGKRFSRAIVSVGRGQGKTYLMAILTAYSYFIESLGLSNQDYLVASINFKQTNKLLGYIKSMMKQIIQNEPFKSLALRSAMRSDPAPSVGSPARICSHCRLSFSKKETSTA